MENSFFDRGAHFQGFQNERACLEFMTIQCRRHYKDYLQTKRYKQIHIIDVINIEEYLRYVY